MKPETTQSNEAVNELCHPEQFSKQCPELQGIVRRDKGIMSGNLEENEFYIASCSRKLSMTWRTSVEEQAQRNDADNAEPFLVISLCG